MQAQIRKGDYRKTYKLSAIVQKGGGGMDCAWYVFVCVGWVVCGVCQVEWGGAGFGEILGFGAGWVRMYSRCGR